jgi:tRNA threonylcarbamoyladenosine biosynthesis protein TsaB
MSAAVVPSSTSALLAFDTSTETMAIAAAGPHGESALNEPGGAAASSHLLPRIEHALAAAGLALRDLAVVAFGRGPGAFTGLRTSCAVAQGLGLGLARPLLPLDSLLVVAEDAFGAQARAAGSSGPRVGVAMDARMDEIYAAVYERQPTGWLTLRAPALYTLAAWNAVLEGSAQGLQGLAGSALSAFGARLHHPPGVVTCAVEADRARALLRLALEAFAAGAAVDAASALPLYLRDRVALTTVERQAIKSAADGGGESGRDRGRERGGGTRAGA